MRYNIPIPSRVGFPAFKSRTDLLIFCSAFFTSSLFFSSGRFNTFSSPMLSGIFKCNPPIISAPYCCKSRPRIPAPSPLNNPIVAIRKTFLLPQSSLFSIIKSRSIFGTVLYCTGQANTSISSFFTTRVILSSSNENALVASSYSLQNNSAAYLELPVPLKYIPTIYITNYPFYIVVFFYISYFLIISSTKHNYN